MSGRNKTKSKSVKTDEFADIPDQAEAIQAVLERGEKDVREGRVLTQEQARRRMARWLER